MVTEFSTSHLMSLQRQGALEAFIDDTAPVALAPTVPTLDIEGIRQRLEELASLAPEASEASDRVQEAAELGLTLADELEELLEELEELKEDREEMHVSKFQDRFDNALPNKVREHIQLDRDVAGLYTATFRGSHRVDPVRIAYGGDLDKVNRAIDDFVDHVSEFYRGLR